MSDENKNSVTEIPSARYLKATNPPQQKKMELLDASKDHCKFGNSIDGFETIYMHDVPEESVHEGSPRNKESAPCASTFSSSTEKWNPWILVNPSSAEQRDWNNELLEYGLPVAVPLFEVGDNPNAVQKAGKTLPQKSVKKKFVK